MGEFVRTHTGSAIKASGDLVTVTLDVAVPSGNVIVVGMSFDPLSTTTPEGTFTTGGPKRVANVINLNGTAGAGLCAWTMISDGSVRFNAGAQHTFQLTEATTARAIHAAEFSGVGDTVEGLITATNAGSTGYTTNIPTTGQEAGDVSICIVATEANSGPWQDSGNTTLPNGGNVATSGGGSAANTGVGIQYAVNTTATSQPSVTLFASDGAGMKFRLPVASAQPPPPPSTEFSGFGIPI